MSTLDRYILRQVIRTALMAAAALMLMILPGLAMNALHRFPVATGPLLFSYMRIAMLALMPYLLPICFLMAVTATFGRLASDREWIAVQMSGLHPLRTLVWPGILALGLAALTFYLMGWVVPDLRYEKRELLSSGTRAALRALQPGRSSMQYGGVFLNRAFTDPDDPTHMFDVYLRVPGKGETPALDAFAQEMWVQLDGENLVVKMFNVEVPNADMGAIVDHEGLLTWTAPLSDLFHVGTVSSTRPDTQSSARLFQRLSEPEEPEVLAAVQFVFHRRIALSCSFVLFLIFGAGLGLTVARGNLLTAFWLSSAFALVYYLFSMQLAQDLALDQGFNPFVAAWTFTGVALVPGLALLRRACLR